MRKKILFLVSKRQKENYKRRIHYEWVEDCKDIYHISLFGPGYSKKLSIKDIDKVVNRFKPDYIFCYNRSRLSKWMPDLSCFNNVPKILVELDTYKYLPSDDWYSQFDKVYCRQNLWEKKHSFLLDQNYFIDYVTFNDKVQQLGLTDKQMRQLAKKYFNKYTNKLKKSSQWKNIDVLKWSIKDNDICTSEVPRKNINFIGRKVDRLYHARQELYKRFQDEIQFLAEWDRDKYFDLLKSSAALICPTESSFGDFVPAKLFEFATSGAAIITNCDLDTYGMKDLNEVVIKYDGIKDLREKIKIDFTPYYGRASEVMKNHTNHIRYGGVFV